jgi:hypothetical protein
MNSALKDDIGGKDPCKLNSFIFLNINYCHSGAKK